jgi:PhnB protein
MEETMPKNPPEDMPRITPLIVYEDVGAATDWLVNAFQFTERMRLPGPTGKIVHSELELGDGVVMLGAAGERPESKTPLRLGGVSHTVYVYVEDVDKHFERAKSAGAVVIQEPETMFWGDRTYVAEDREGHRWLFAQRVKDNALSQS